MRSLIISVIFVFLLTTGFAVNASASEEHEEFLRNLPVKGMVTMIDLGKKTCIIGNIDCQELLPEGTPDEVERAVRETLEIASPGGSYIISSSNSIHPGVIPENYIAMVEAVHKYGEYV